MVNLANGRVTFERLEDLLPAGWCWEGKRVLDFGCGAGRTLRHLLNLGAELHGSDGHGSSIAWIAQHLSQKVQAICNDEQPPLPYPDSLFDLVYSLSVFTHLVDSWEEWLLELRRLLRPEGLLVATFLNERSWEQFESGPWEEEAGMIVTKRDNPWALGGPFVYVSEAWIREHWDGTSRLSISSASRPGRCPPRPPAPSSRGR